MDRNFPDLPVTLDCLLPLPPENRVERTTIIRHQILKLLGDIKKSYPGDPEKYDQFLQEMGNYSNNLSALNNNGNRVSLDELNADVEDRIAILFEGQPQLLEDFLAWHNQNGRKDEQNDSENEREDEQNDSNGVSTPYYEDISDDDLPVNLSLIKIYSSSDEDMAETNSNLPRTSNATTTPGVDSVTVMVDVGNEPLRRSDRIRQNVDARDSQQKNNPIQTFPLDLSIRKSEVDGITNQNAASVSKNAIVLRGRKRRTNSLKKQISVSSPAAKITVSVRGRSRRKTIIQKQLSRNDRSPSITSITSTSWRQKTAKKALLTTKSLKPPSDLSSDSISEATFFLKIRERLWPTKNYDTFLQCSNLLNQNAMTRDDFLQHVHPCLKDCQELYDWLTKFLVDDKTLIGITPPILVPSVSPSPTFSPESIISPSSLGPVVNPKSIISPSSLGPVVNPESIIPPSSPGHADNPKSIISPNRSGPSNNPESIITPSNPGLAGNPESIISPGSPESTISPGSPESTISPTSPFPAGSPESIILASGSSPAGSPEFCPFDVKKLPKHGRRYRVLPDNHIPPKCSGRTALCDSVLNDTHVCIPPVNRRVPVKVVSMLDQAYFEVEDERYEIDLIIERATSCFEQLKSVLKEMTKMSEENLEKFKLGESLGGTPEFMIPLVITTMYGEEAGPKYIEALKNSPSISIPYVLRRIKGKLQEWRNAQKEFNQQWRDKIAIELEVSKGRMAPTDQLSPE